MHLRRGRPDDTPSIVDFQIAMARETEDLTLDRETVTRGVKAVFENPARGTYWVVEGDGILLGSLLCIDEWSDWRNGTVWWIHSVYVIPPARQKGIFTRLFHHLKALVESSPHLKGLRLYVEQDNHRAQAIYRSLGMGDNHYRMFEWLK